jgi:hypothetical protein
MGFAFTGLADDVNAVLYNPAGLVDLTQQFQSGFYDFKKYQFAQKEGWALSFGGLTYGQYLYRETGGTLYRCYASAGAFKTDNYGRLGVCWKKLESSVAGDLGWGLDVGYLYRNLTPNLSAGVLLKNVFKEKNEEPLTIRGGLAYNFDKTTTITFDFETPFKSIREVKDYQFFYGLEAQSEKNFRYRLGWSSEGLAAGISWEINLITFEYSLTKVPQAAETIQSFGICLGVSQENKSGKEEEEK